MTRDILVGCQLVGKVRLSRTRLTRVSGSSRVTEACGGVLSCLTRRLQARRSICRGVHRLGAPTRSVRPIVRGLHKLRLLSSRRCTTDCMHAIVGARLGKPRIVQRGLQRGRVNRLSVSDTLIRFAPRQRLTGTAGLTGGLFGHCGGLPTHHRTRGIQRKLTAGNCTTSLFGRVGSAIAPRPSLRRRSRLLTGRTTGT